MIPKILICKHLQKTKKISEIRITREKRNLLQSSTMKKILFAMCNI